MTTIIPHDQHGPEDYISPGRLRPEAVNVRLTRESRGRYRTEISILYGGYTDTAAVADAIYRRPKCVGVVLSRQRPGELIVTAPAGFRAPAGFVRVDSLFD